ncbi:MAG: siphovirus Gp157 family protein, partial [Paracoccaceae bacterium]
AADLVRELTGDDARLAHDLVEGETDFFEAVEAALSEIDECDILIAGLKDHEATLKARRSSIEKRRDRLRGLIDQAFQMASIESHRFATATITTKAVPPKVVILDESEIPARFFTPQPPKLDRSALLAAAKIEAVPGAQLSNGGTTIQIRRS